MTRVINLFGGPGSGKSTLSCELFYKLKRQGLSTELVREYVKDWAWEGRKVGNFDQIYICGKQAKKESSLYHKVDTVVTDSPLLLSPFYEEFYQGRDIVRDSVLKFLAAAKQDGIQHLNFFVTRKKKYDPKGRYETEEQVRNIDEAMKTFLTKNGIPFIILDQEEEQRADEIINSVLKQMIPFHTVT